ncbi:hypothetical protein [Methylophaga sp.]|uniref:hypothetical protein n=1 Tax=Methylophaga sp. TaxID=2024840 RepID=UPI003A950A0A
MVLVQKVFNNSFEVLVARPQREGFVQNHQSFRYANYLLKLRLIVGIEIQA